MNMRKIVLALAITLIIAIFFILDLGRFFSLDYVKNQQAAIDAYRAAYPALTAGIFFAIYVAVTGLSPVMMTLRMPASVKLRKTAAMLALGGSWKATSPK